MRNLKKFLALVLAMMMTLSLMVTVNAATYPDMDKAEDAFVEGIEVLSGVGVIKGDEKGNFNPTANITRAEAAAIMYRIVTGDVKDEHNGLHTGAVQFTDVKDGDWFAGYVGYCADQGIIKGRPDGSFGPQANVTGYEMLAMLLRAIGYGQKGEFTGYGWEVSVGSRATTLGILDNVKTTAYGGNLRLAARRDVVADLAFQSITVPATVTVSSLGDYNQYTSLVSGVLNPTLGDKVFGLASMTGIIVGNQATGEAATKLGVGLGKDDDGYYLSGVNYIYADETAATDTAGTYANLSFDLETGLDKFGHKVTVWYNYRSSGDPKAVGNGTQAGSLRDNFSTVYCAVDNATRVDLVYEDADETLTTGELNKAIKAADFTVRSAGAHVSDAFDPILAEATSAAATDGDSDVYLLISNSGAKGDETNALDLVVALDVGLAQVSAKNDYSSPKQVTLDVDGATDIVIDRAAASTFNNLLVYGEDAVKVNNWVVVNGIAGTSNEFGNTDGGDTIDELFGIDAITEKVSGRITSIDGKGTVTIDGKEYPASVLWETTLTANTNRGKSNLTIGNTVTLHLDKYGKYVRVTTGGADELMGAYAYWQQDGIDGIKYYLQGVTADGETVVKEITQKSYFDTFANQGEHNIPIHHMRNTNESGGTAVGGNLQIVAPDLSNGTGYVDYSVDADGNVGDPSWDDLTTLPAAFSFTADTKTVDDGIFLSANTKFHVVTGWGSSLKVETLTGLTALLKGANSVTAQGYYFTSADDTEQSSSQNNVVESVLLVNAKWIQPNSFLYVGNNVPDAGAATRDSKAHQFQVYTVGKDTETGILIADDTYPATTGTAYTDLEAHTFYTYTLTSEGYYQLIKDPMDGDGLKTGYGVKNKTLDASSSNEGTAFGYIYDGTNSWNALNATVLDVSGDDHGITNYETLRRAVERNTITVDILLTTVGGSTASVIYVTSVTPR